MASTSAVDVSADRALLIKHISRVRSELGYLQQLTLGLTLDPLIMDQVRDAEHAVHSACLRASLLRQMSTGK